MGKRRAKRRAKRSAKRGTTRGVRCAVCGGVRCDVCDVALCANAGVNSPSASPPHYITRYGVTPSMVAGGVTRAAFAQSLEAANCRVTVANTEMECDTTPLNKHVRRIEEGRGATRSVRCAVCGVLCATVLCSTVLCETVLCETVC